tara:strand:+ start:90 stop:461 length:372 start_codon:yes stop_codon:yes gene_type:complete
MVLSSEVKYDTRIKNFEDISPESVMFMLREIKEDIGRLDFSFTEFDLMMVLEVVEAGEYEIKGNSINTHIDLSSAKSVIVAYRESTEGGCKSCVNLKREMLDAQSATSVHIVGFLILILIHNP